MIDHHVKMTNALTHFEKVDHFVNVISHVVSTTLCLSVWGVIGRQCDDYSYNYSYNKISNISKSKMMIKAPQEIKIRLADFKTKIP